jgi:hypothetical protein
MDLVFYSPSTTSMVEAFSGADPLEVGSPSVVAALFVPSVMPQ